MNLYVNIQFLYIKDETKSKNWNS